MPPAILDFVSPQEWLSRTSVFIGSRRAALRKADAAYNNYYNDRSEKNKRALYQALHQYLVEKGGNWGNVPRDKSSGGLMAYIYYKTKAAEEANIQAKRVPDARHGVLYLWQHADVRTQWARIALEGVLGVGSATTSGLQASGYTGADKLNWGVISQGSHVNLVPEGLVGVKVADGIVFGPKGSARLSELRDDPKFMERVRQFFGRSFQAIYDSIRQSIEEIWKNIQLKWYSNHMAGTAGTVTTSLVNFVLGQIVKHAAPFVGNVIKVAQGFVQAFKAAKDRLSAWYQRTKFIIAPGHPQLIGHAIETQMNWEMGKGLYNLAKGGVLLTADLLTLGASALVNIIAACVEFVYKACTRYAQASNINAWVKQVHDVTRDQNAWEKDPLDGKKRPSIVYNDRKFLHLFEDGCNASVCVPMMTLNSGIAGDLMMFVKMFDDTGRILGQSTDESLHGPSAAAQKKFDAGQAYWSLLKQRSRDYLESTGLEFWSSDKLVRSLMYHAIKNHNSIASFTDRVLAFGSGSLAA